MKKVLVTAVLLSLLASVFVMSGCGGKNENTLLVGTEPTFAPFEFRNETTKKFDGFDIDLINAIGKELGRKVKIVNMGFDGLIPALMSKSLHIVISGMTITAERGKKVSFSRHYYQSGLTIVVRKDEKTIKSFKDLEGRKIGVQIGTTGAKAAKNIKDAKVTTLNTAPDAFMALQQGNVDAVINDLPVNQDYLKKKGGSVAKMVGEVQNAEFYGIAVNKGNTKLLAGINKALNKLMKNGSYDALYRKWFGKNPTWYKSN